MRGFLVGTLVLVAVQVGLQPGTAAKATGGVGVLLSLIHRALSPGVAGVPDRTSVHAEAHKLQANGDAGQSGLGSAGAAGKGAGAGGGGGSSW